MSQSLRKLVLKARREVLGRRHDSSIHRTLHEEELHRSAVDDQQQHQSRDASTISVSRATDSRMSLPEQLPFSSINHFNLALAHAVKDERWKDVGALEHSLVVSSLQSAEAARSTSGSLEDEDLDIEHPLVSCSSHSSSRAVEPSSETFQLFMAGRIQLGDWLGALEYFNLSQQRGLPVQDTSLRMVMRAYRLASPSSTVWMCALNLFRSFQHRVTSSDTLHDTVDVLFSGSRYGDVIKVYHEAQSVIPLEHETMEMVSLAAKMDQQWEVAMKLAEGAFRASAPVATSRMLIANAFNSLVRAGEFRRVLNGYQVVRRNPSSLVLLGDDALLAAARSACTLMYPQWITDIYQVAQTVVADHGDTLQELCSLILVLLHRRCCMLSVTSPQLHDLVSAATDLSTQTIEEAVDKLDNKQLSMFCSSWEFALRSMPSIRNIDPLATAVVTKSLCRSHKWSEAISLLRYVHEQASRQAPLKHPKKTIQASKRDLGTFNRDAWRLHSPVTIWSVLHVLRCLPNNSNHTSGTPSLQRCLFLSQCVEQGWVTPHAAEWLLDFVSDSNVTSSVSMKINGEHATQRTLLALLLHNPNHSVTRYLRLVQSLQMPLVSNDDDHSKVVDDVISFVTAEAVKVTHHGGECSDAPDIVSEVTLATSVALELVKVLTSLPTAELYAVTKQCRYLEGPLCRWLCCNGSVEQCLLLLNSISCTWSMYLSTTSCVEQHGRVMEALEQLWNIQAEVLATTSSSAVQVANIALRAAQYLMDNRSENDLCHALMRLDPLCLSLISERVGVLLLRMQDVVPPRSANVRIMFVDHLLATQVKDEGLVSSAVKLMLSDIKMCPLLMNGYLDSRYRNTRAQMKHVLTTTAITRCDHWETILSALRCTTLPDELSVTLFSELILTQLAMWLPKSLSNRQHVAEAIVAAWCRTVNQRYDTSEFLHGAMVMIHALSDIPLTRVVLACTQTNAGAATHLCRAYLTWCLEGRMVPKMHYAGILALPPTRHLFVSIVEALSRDCHAGTMNILEHEPTLRKNLLIMGTTVNRGVNALWLFDVLQAQSSSLLSDVTFCRHLVRAAGSEKTTSVDSCSQSKTNEYSSEMWKLLLAMPVLVADVPHSVGGVQMVRTALAQRPRTMWQSALQWVVQALSSGNAPRLIFGGIGEVTSSLLESLRQSHSQNSTRVLSELSKSVCSNVVETGTDLQQQREVVVLALKLRGMIPVAKEENLSSVQSLLKCVDDSHYRNGLTLAAEAVVVRSTSSTSSLLALALCVLHELGGHVESIDGKTPWNMVAEALQLVVDTGVHLRDVLRVFRIPTSSLLELICVAIADRRFESWSASLFDTVMLDYVSRRSKNDASVEQNTRVKIVHCCVSLGRWRELSRIVLQSFDSWQALLRHDDDTFHIRCQMLVEVLAASWSYQGNLFSCEEFSFFVDRLQQEWPTKEREPTRVSLKEFIIACRDHMFSTVDAVSTIGAETFLVQLMKVANRVWLLPVLEHTKPLPPPSERQHSESTWQDALKSLLCKESLSESETRALFSPTSTSRVTAYQFLRHWQAPHVSKRVPQLLCEMAINSAPRWEDAVALVMSSRQTVRNPMAVQRYLMFLTLEGIRTGKWQRAEHSTVAARRVSWEVALTLLHCTTDGSFQFLSQRHFLEVLRHCVHKPDVTLRLYQELKANKYARLEGIHSLLSLLRSARLCRRKDLVEIAVTDFISQAPQLSSDNRMKFLQELTCGAILHNVISASEMRLLCNKIKAAVELGDAESLLIV